MRAFPWAVVVSVGLAGSPALAKSPKDTPTFAPLVDLGTLVPEHAVSDGWAINDAGLVVGSSANVAVAWVPPADRSLTGYTIKALRLDLTGEVAGTFGTSARVLGLNNLGQIVGIVSANLGGAGVILPRAAVWDAHDQAPRSLALLPGARGSNGRVINDWGQVAGSVGGPSGSFLVTWREGVPEVLPTLGGAGGLVHALNNVGQMTGTLPRGQGGPAVPVAWLPDGDGYRVVELPNLGDATGNFDFGRGINDAGLIVGCSGLTTGAFDVEGFPIASEVGAFVWDLTDGDVTRFRPGPATWPAALAPAPDADAWAALRLNGTANGINERSEAVGYVGVNGSLDGGDGELYYLTTAAYWRNGGKAPVLLGTLGGANSFARAINERGEIVGLADTADGETHAFITRRQQ